MPACSQAFSKDVGLFFFFFDQECSWDLPLDGAAIAARGTNNKVIVVCMELY